MYHGGFLKSNIYIYTYTYVYTTTTTKSLQSCPTLCNPIDSSPPGSAIPGILQARTLEWVAISFSNAWKWKVRVKSLSRVWLFATPWTAAHQAPLSMGFSRQENWSGVPLPSPTYVYSHTHTFCLIYLAFQNFILFFQNYLLIRLCWVLVVACGSFSCGMLLVSMGSFGLVQLLSHVQLFATPWTAARQASLSISNSRTCSNLCPSCQWCHPTISSHPTWEAIPKEPCQTLSFAKPWDLWLWPMGSSSLKESDIT